ncbi:ATP-binding protein [Azonexus caeni]|jgi:PAS domain S-box-containing protein
MTGKFGLIGRIALLVVLVEIVVFGVLGGFYVSRFSSALDERMIAGLRNVGRMLASESLPISSLSQESLIADLVGAPYLEGLAVGGNGRVIVATDSALLGLAAASLPGIDPRWLAAEAPDEQWIAAGDRLTSVQRLRGESASAPLYTAIIAVSTEALSARKQSIILLGVIGSLFFIVLSSAVLIVVAQRFIGRRVSATLAVLKRVEEGALDERIPVTSEDELGELQRGTNSMIARVREILDELRASRAALARSEERMALALQGANDGIWDWDLVSNEVYFSPRWKSMLGYGEHELADEFATWERLTDDEGRERTMRLIDDVLSGRARVFDIEFRMRHKAGDWVDIRSRAFLQRDADGKPLRLVGTHVDISERKRAEAELDAHRHHLESLVKARTAELEVARDIAEAASRAKSTFLANMSHELRTPMNAIMGMTAIALRHAEDARLRDQLEKIDSASRHLLHVINDILDISKIEAERLILERTRFRLGEPVENLLSLIGHKVTEKGLRLDVDLAPDLAACHVLGDPVRLGQVLINLTANAIKFTQQGSIVLRCRVLEENRNGLQLLWEVVDTGIGIAAEDQKRLFNAFEQTDSSMTRKYGGTGLGLAISRRLVKMMGGEIGVESALARGSRFWFTVRLEKAGDVAVEAAPSDEALSAEARLLQDYAGVRVLLAEDEPINQEVSLGLLGDVGLTVDLAEDGQKAVALASEKRYDLILMDMQMPNLNGLDATRAIRAGGPNAATPILAMTANAFDEDRQVCLNAGMNDHIAKPIDPDHLYMTLLHWLAKRAA